MHGVQEDLPKIALEMKATSLASFMVLLLLAASPNGMLSPYLHPRKLLIFATDRGWLAEWSCE